MNREKCSACLSEIDFKPWDGENASFEICPFCGIQFGYDDMAGGDINKRKEIYKRWNTAWDRNNKKALTNEQKLEVINSNNTDNIINFHELETLLREAFQDVTKGDGIGVREAIAIDDHKSASEIEKARSEDVEQNWWEIDKNWHKMLGTALSFTDTQGFRFLLPATITYDDPHSAYFHLCFPYTDNQPHHGHKEYINYLKNVTPAEIIEKYNFNDEQTRAIAMFLKWWMQENESHIYANRKKAIDKFEKTAIYKKGLSKNDYNLNIEDEIAFFDEECRILRDWLKLGKVEI